MGHPAAGAAAAGLVPPRAIALFGPPGTGKTTFVKGAASRLGWPFVELFPSRLAGESPADLPAFTLITAPTPVQHRAFDLLGLSHGLGYM